MGKRSKLSIHSRVFLVILVLAAIFSTFFFIIQAIKLAAICFGVALFAVLLVLMFNTLPREKKLLEEEEKENNG